MIKFTLPTLTKSTIDPKEISRICPKCSSKAHIHGKSIRNIRDIKTPTVEQIRLKCSKCKHTWFVYASGVRPYSGRTVHLVFMGILLYSFGLSFDKVVLVLYALTLQKLEVRSTVWSDFQRSGMYLHVRKMFSSGGMLPQIISEDGTYVRIKGQKACITFLNNADDNFTIAIYLADERVEKELAGMFRHLANELNLTSLYAICSDGNTTIPALIDDLNGLNSNNNKISYHQIRHASCGAHSKKNFRKRINEYLEETV